MLYEKKFASFTCYYFPLQLTLLSAVTSLLTSTSLLNVCCALLSMAAHSLHFSRSVMVPVGMSELGRTELHIVESGVKVNGEYYRETLLKRGLLPDMRGISDIPAKCAIHLTEHMKLSLFFLSKHQLSSLRHCGHPTFRIWIQWITGCGP